MKGTQLITVGVILITLTVFSCRKNDDVNSDVQNNPTNGTKYPYFTVDNDTFGGIATKEDGFYGTLRISSGNCTDINNHRIKIQNLKIIDTTKFNTTASITFTSGSQSIYFKNKGNYALPLTTTEAVHSSCVNLNSCGKANILNFDHEGADFLDINLTINNFNYKVYSGTFTISTFDDPFSGTFKGKAYKAKQTYTGLQNDLSFYDTTKTYDITTKLK